MKKSGFTLVELLIVVAIVGVLTTVGIPTFRRMVQKSKMAEAKVNLGGIYKSEAGFFAEWDAYTNIVGNTGFGLAHGAVSNGHNGTYAMGFPVGSCVHAVGTIYPEETSPQGQRLAKEYPAWGTGYAVYIPVDIALIPGAYCLPSETAPDGSTYLATASGVVSRKYNRSSSNPNEVDQWTINEKRELVHFVDGTN